MAPHGRSSGFGGPCWPEEQLAPPEKGAAAALAWFFAVLTLEYGTLSDSAEEGDSSEDVGPHVCGGDSRTSCDWPVDLVEVVDGWKWWTGGSGESC